MRVFYIIIFSFSFVISASCQFRNIKPSEKVSTKSYSDFNNFTSLDLANDFKAYITFTDGPDLIKIEANENLQEYITVDMDGSTLTIKFNGDWNNRGEPTLIAYISSKQLKNFRASGDSFIYFKNNLDTEKAKITLRGDSQLNGKVSVNNLYLNLRGDSIIELDGEANEVEAELRGDSIMKGSDLAVTEAKITLRGDSVAELDVSNKLWADLNGDSVLKYGGSPQIMQQRVAGDSEIKRKN
jgi:hypothetical protein